MVQGMEDRTNLYDKHEQLHVLVATLAENVKNGFDGVHRRQDIANGRLAKLEGDVGNLETTSEAQHRRVEELEKIHNVEKEIKNEQSKTRRWLRKEVFAVLLHVISTLIMAWVALRLGLN